MVAAFVIGNSFVVLPLVIESVRKLHEAHDVASDAEGRQPEYLVPLAYPFPDIGRIVGLIFIPFAAWFFGRVIDSELYPALLGVGFLGSFGKPVITIPLLLNLAELPSDIFNFIPGVRRCCGSVWRPDENNAFIDVHGADNLHTQ